jgi:hypothetical protein
MGYEIINTGSRLFQPHFAPWRYSIL